LWKTEIEIGNLAAIDELGSDYMKAFIPYEADG
jgi:hypothetical protein